MEGFNVNKVDKKDGYAIINIAGDFSLRDIFVKTAKLDVLFGVQCFDEDGKLKEADLVMTEEESHKAEKIFEGSLITKDISVLSVKGMGLSHNFDVLVRIYECLYDCQIEVKLISVGETKILVAVDSDRGQDAYNAVSKGLYGM